MLLARSDLPLLTTSPWVWFEVGEGTLGLMLEGDELPVGWTPKEEQMVRVGSLTLSTPIAAGTHMTLRNAGDGPLVHYRITLTRVMLEHPRWDARFVSGRSSSCQNSVWCSADNAASSPLWDRRGSRGPSEHVLGEAQYLLLVGNPQVGIGETAKMSSVEPFDLDRLPQRPQPLDVDLDWSRRRARVVPALNDEQWRLHPLDVSHRRADSILLRLVRRCPAEYRRAVSP